MIVEPPVILAGFEVTRDDRLLVQDLAHRPFDFGGNRMGGPDRGVVLKQQMKIDPVTIAQIAMANFMITDAVSARFVFQDFDDLVLDLRFGFVH